MNESANAASLRAKGLLRRKWKRSPVISHVVCRDVVGSDWARAPASAEGMSLCWHSPQQPCCSRVLRAGVITTQKLTETETTLDNGAPKMGLTMFDCSFCDRASVDGEEESGSR